MYKHISIKQQNLHFSHIFKNKQSRTIHKLLINGLLTYSTLYRIIRLFHHRLVSAYILFKIDIGFSQNNEH